MLGALSLSGISGTSSSLSQEVDLELIDQIIDRSPRNATSFPLVYRAYGEVLEENGLSPANDAAYYQFLLKLGVIRAPTWGERWDIWRAANAVSARIQASSHSLDDVRARLPFLASASSNLDEGFEAESYEDGSLHMVEERPSPRKQMALEAASKSRSLVGYTPSHSIDYDLGTFNPPLRTSTPVYARDIRFSPPTPPPYSVSDDTEELLHEVSAQGSDPGTPKADLRDGLDIWVEEKALYEREREEMERQADQFFETGLMGRCWDVWTQSNEWIKSTTERIDQVRATILLRQTLLRWRKAHEHNLQLPNTAKAHYEHHRKSQALKIWIDRYKTVELARREDQFIATKDKKRSKDVWRKWRSELGRRRTELWERNMKARERAFTERRKSDLQNTVFTKWREVLQIRSADTFFRDKLLRAVFDNWRNSAVRSQDLNQICDDHLMNQQKRNVKVVFTTWRKKVELKPTEEAISRNRLRRLIQGVWDHWRIVCSQQRAADSFAKRSTQTTALQRWAKVMKKIKMMENTAVDLARQHDNKLLRGVIDTWALQERGCLLGGVLDKRLLRKVYSTWQGRQTAIRVLEDQAQAFQRKSSKNNSIRVFSLWRSESGRQKSLELHASLVWETRRKAQTLTKWIEARRKIETNVVDADKARAFFLQREALDCWKAALARSRQKGLLERRRIADLGRIFSHWRAVTQRQKKDEDMIRSLHHVRDGRILSGVISRWTLQVINVKSRELDVVEQRDQALQRTALNAWMQAMKKHRDSSALLQSVIDVKREDHLRTIFTAWRIFTRRARERRVLFERLKRERRSKLLSDTFSIWVERKRMRELHAVEEEVSLRHEDVILFTVFDHWKARSKRLPAITFENTRIKKMALDRWKRAFPRAIKLKEAARAEERRLLEETFSTWKGSARRRTAARVGRQRGRIRPSLGLETRPPSDSIARADSSRYPTFIPLSFSQPRSPPVTNTPNQEIFHRIPSSSASVTTPPAYSRLRSELGRRRGGSDEPEEERRLSSGSEVLKALKVSLPDR